MGNEGMTLSELLRLKTPVLEGRIPALDVGESTIVLLTPALEGLLDSPIAVDADSDGREMLLPYELEELIIGLDEMIVE